MDGRRRGKGAGQARVHDESTPAENRQLLCLIPADLEAKALDQLRHHFRDQAEINVLVEHRACERRSGAERRSADLGPPCDTEERRKIRNPAGRRVGERRAKLQSVEPPNALPRRIRAYGDRIEFAQRTIRTAEQLEDMDTARLVTRIQAGDREAFSTLYERYFDRVYGYLRVTLRDAHEAEDVSQQVFLQAMEKLDTYERRRQPFRAWLFTIARNTALNRLRDLGRTVVVDPGEVGRQLEANSEESAGHTLQWISDADLLILIERLPMPQQQALVLRYQLDMSAGEIGEVLGRSPDDVRMLQHRAQRFLRDRLMALGRAPSHQRRGRMRSRVPEAVILRARRFSLVR